MLAKWVETFAGFGSINSRVWCIFWCEFWCELSCKVAARKLQNISQVFACFIFALKHESWVVKSGRNVWLSFHCDPWFSWLEPLLVLGWMEIAFEKPSMLQRKKPVETKLLTSLHRLHEIISKKFPLAPQVSLCCTMAQLHSNLLQLGPKLIATWTVICPLIILGLSKCLIILIGFT